MKPQSLERIASEIREGMTLPKCLKCGCMHAALDGLSEALPQMDAEAAADLTNELNGWLGRLEEQEFACAGCAHCFGAAAANALHDFLDEVEPPSPTVSTSTSAAAWPPMPGDYFVLGDGLKRPVAVTTLGDQGLTDGIASTAPVGLSIVGKTETENIGIDKLIKNTITNPSLRFLILAGHDPEGHRPGQTLKALMANGVDESMRVIGSEGRRPVLKNVTDAVVEAFRKKIELVDMIGTTDVDAVVDKVIELAMKEKPCSCVSRAPRNTGPEDIGAPLRVMAEAPAAGELDRAGYFVVIPEPSTRRIVVEHYGYDDGLLHTVEGPDARSIYFTVIRNGWLTQLSHAAYLGKELEKAELSMKHGFRYVQDGM